MKRSVSDLFDIVKKRPNFRYKIKHKSAFTIVELLVVIVVIDILATITTTSYIGVTNKAFVALLVSDLSNASKQLKIDQAVNNAYPTTLDEANSGNGISASVGNTYTDFQYRNENPQAFCLTAENNNGVSYRITNDSDPVPGTCSVLTDGLSLNLDASIASSYPGTGTSWVDLSGNGINGTLTNNVGYTSANNGALVFDGINDYVSISSAPNNSVAGSLSSWVYINSWKTSYDGIIFKGINSSWSGIDYGLFRNSNSNVFLGTLNNGTNNLSGSGPRSSPITLKQWYYLVFTWDSTVTKFYTNGVETGSVNYSYGAGTRSTNMKIGSDVAGTTYFFDGSIANIHIYNKALNADEVKNNFNALRSRFGI